MSSPLRPVAPPFVAAGPAGARVRTRLRVSAQDEAVLRAAGRHLGSLAGRDLAARCAEGRLDARGRAISRARRKRALTAESSSRWAGAITRASEDQWQLAGRNLLAERSGLHARIRTIKARLPVPAGGRAGRARGYATGAERHAKMVRLAVLRARLAAVDLRLAAGTVSVVRGGKALLRTRGNLAAAGLAEAPGAARSPRRPPAVRSVMTSATIRRGIAGTSTRPGASRRCLLPRWRTCAGPRSWPWT
jgi:hypothetical protein